MGLASVDWRGPRPYRPGDSDRLVGRQRELAELYTRCQSFSSYDVIEVTAPSGVGKTSFVAAGAIPMFKANEMNVLPEGEHSWANSLKIHDDVQRRGDGMDNPALLYALALGRPPSDGDRPSKRLIEELSGGADTVVVLDQLEELLRYREPLGTALLRLVGRVARATRIPHIVIARSEYLDMLRAVEVPDVAVWNVRLQAIDDDDDIRTIVTAPLDAVESEVSYDDEAVTRLIDWWRAAQRGRYDDGRSFADGMAVRGDVGLLHLHAMLWSLKEWSKENGDPDHLTVALLDRFAEAHGGSGAQVVTDAIEDYVATTIEHVAERSDIWWKNGPSLLMARVAAHLSSADYKIPQALSSLLPSALRDELEPGDVRTMQRTARAHRRRLSDEGIEDQAEKDARFVTALAQDYPIKGAGLATRRDFGDGPTPEVTAEMIRCLLAGLDGLLQANVLRVFEPGDDPIYELVHDSFGAALNRWAEDRILSTERSVIGVIADRPGQAMTHSLDPAVFVDGDGSVDPRWGAVEVSEHAGRTIAIVRNAIWSGNEVTGCTLRDLVFEDCDFRGSVFLDVELENVAFRRCNLRGVAMLRGCSFSGVRFDNGGGDPEALNTLTLRQVRATGSDVSFESLDGTRGLVLERLLGGRWRFEGADIGQLLVTAEAGDVEVGFRDSAVDQLTLALERRNPDASGSDDAGPATLSVTASGATFTRTNVDGAVAGDEDLLTVLRTQ